MCLNGVRELMWWKDENRTLPLVLSPMCSSKDWFLLQRKVIGFRMGISDEFCPCISWKMALLYIPLLLVLPMQAIGTSCLGDLASLVESIQWNKTDTAGVADGGWAENLSAASLAIRLAISEERVDWLWKFGVTLNQTFPTNFGTSIPSTSKFRRATWVWLDIACVLKFLLPCNMRGEIQLPSSYEPAKLNAVNFKVALGLGLVNGNLNVGHDILLPPADRLTMEELVWASPPASTLQWRSKCSRPLISTFKTATSSSMINLHTQRQGYSTCRLLVPKISNVSLTSQLSCRQQQCELRLLTVPQRSLRHKQNGYQDVVEIIFLHSTRSSDFWTYWHPQRWKRPLSTKSTP